MSRLQLFDFLSSGYERPNRKWVCGHAADGQACRNGPRSDGRCGGISECRPANQDGRWVCTRPAADGGPCDGGPMPGGACAHPVPPCVPVPSLRTTRGRTVIWALVATIGFLAIALAGGRQDNMPMPGPMTAAHTSVSDCKSCHATVHATGGSWIKAAFGTVDTGTETERCLACHKLGPAPANPHGLTDKKLAAMTRMAAARRSDAARPAVFRVQSLLFDGAGYEDGKVACATCHVEHRGHEVDLTTVDNSTCQTCHTVQFGGLADGHPDFDGYPYLRRTRIIFDHNSHFDRHFPKSTDKPTPAFCTDCHEPGAVEDGRFMVNKPFEKVCAACHQDQIDGSSRASGPKGVTVLTVPGLDTATLREHGIAVGEWPEYSEAPLTPFAKALLLLRGVARDDLTAVDNLDLLDLTNASKADLEAVARIAWAVKEMLVDLVRSDLPALADQLAAADGGKGDRQKAIRLFANLSRDVLEGMARDWLPNLDQEVADHRGGKTVWGPKGAPEPAPPKAEAPAQPAADAGKTADQSAILGKPDQSDILGQSGPEKADILGQPDADQSDILGQPAAAADQSDILGQPAPEKADILGQPAPDQSDILAKPAEQSDILGQPAPSSDILGAAPAQSGLDALAASPAAPVTEEAAPPAPAKPVDAESWAALGGWYRKDFAVLYRPVSHADGFLKAWLDYTGANRNSPRLGAVASRLFKTLADKNAQGQCVKCHSVDQTASGALSVNWHEYNGTDMSGTTVYSHQPHFALQGKEGCDGCHKRNPKADYLAAYKTFDVTPHQSNFKQMDRRVCAQCHTPEIAGDTCTTCHRYHAGVVQTPLLMTHIPGQAAQPPAPSATNQGPMK